MLVNQTSVTLLPVSRTLNFLAHLPLAYNHPVLRIGWPGVGVGRHSLIYCPLCQLSYTSFFLALFTPLYRRKSLFAELLRCLQTL